MRLIKFLVICVCWFNPMYTYGSTDLYEELIRVEQQALVEPIQYITILSSEQSVDKSPTSKNLFHKVLLARLYSFHGDVTLAKLTFDSVFPQLPETDTWLRGYWMLYRSNLSLGEGKLPQALKQIDQAIALFVRSNDLKMQIRARTSKAILLLWQEDYKLSIELLEAAYLASKTSQIPDSTMNYVYTGFAAYYTSMSIFDQAIKFAELAKDNVVNNGDVVNGLPIISVLCSTYERAQQLDLANACYEQMIDLSVTVKVPRYLFWGPAGKASVAIKQQDYSTALKLLYLAKSYLPDLAINPAHVVALYNNFAKSFIALNQPAQALEYLARSEELLNQYQRPLNNRYKRNTLLLKAKSQEIQKDFVAANESLWLFIDLVEEAKLSTQQKLEQEARSKFESTQQEIKLQLAEEKLKNQQIELERLEKDAQLQTAYSIIGFLAFVSISIFTFNQHKAFRKSQYRANTDVLTGAPNRRYILDFVLKKLLEREKLFAVAILDIDHFKHVNDKYGHDIGDQALIGFTQTLNEYLSDTDCKFARFGGEEFLVVMPGYDITKAKAFITGLCDLIRATSYTEETISLTSSAGVSQYIKGIQLNAILKQADEKLYEAKNTGRDKVCS